MYEINYVSLPSLFPLVRLLNLSGRPDSGYLTREGVEVLGIVGSSIEEPVPEDPPLNLVLYIYLRILAYSSNIRIVSFDPMTSSSPPGLGRI